MSVALAADNYPFQAQYFMQLLEAVKGNGVYTGLAPTASGTPDNKVVVASGRFAQGGTILNSAGGNSPTLAAADATNPRIDLIQMDTSAGAPYITKKTGTAAANPVAPSPDANSIVVAYIYVRATGAAPVIKDTDDSVNAYIIDGRCYCPVKMGSATIVSGNSTLTVSDASVTANSKIFLQPSQLNKSYHANSITLSTPQVGQVGYSAGGFNTTGGGTVTFNSVAENWYVDNIVAGTSFRINVTNATTSNMSFDYMIVG